MSPNLIQRLKTTAEGDMTSRVVTWECNTGRYAQCWQRDRPPLDLPWHGSA